MRKVYLKVITNVLVTCDEDQNFNDLMENFEVLVDLGNSGELGEAEVISSSWVIEDSK